MNKNYLSLLAALVLAAPALAEADKPAQNEPPVDKFKGIGRIQDFNKAIAEERQAFGFLHSKEPAKAVEHFQSAIAIYPNLPRAYMGMGMAQERQNNLKEAEDSYRGAIKCDTSNWRAWKRLANLLYQQQHYTEAREALGNASALHPPKKAQAQIDQMIQALEAAQRNGHADSVSRFNTGEDQ